MKTLIWLLMLVLLTSPWKVQAANDTTTFRINVIQDSVYAGQTVDVEFFVEKPRMGIIQNVLNLLGQFEIEVATDTSRIAQHRTTFSFDRPSLESFFNTLFSNLQTSSLLNPVTGTLNMKVKSNKGGSGNARVGKGQYIVQDNAAGRKQMQFYFTKAIVKSLLGLDMPVKVLTDSVYVIGEPTPIMQPPAKAVSRVSGPKDQFKVYPNPVSDFLQVQGKDIRQYELCNSNGLVVSSAMFPETPGFITIPMAEMQAGFYLLKIFATDDDLQTYKILKP